MKKQEKNLLIQDNWLLFFLFLIFISNNDTRKVNIKELDLLDLDKKARFINRIKGYMNADEQYVLQSVETLVYIIKNIKILMEPPNIASAGVNYSSLSIEDRKRNMLMDISEFLEDEKKILVHKAVDFDVKVKTLEEKLHKVHSILNENNPVESINQYIDVFEPLLEEGVKTKANEFKKIISIVNIIENLRNKDSFDEMDLIEIIKPLVDKEQEETLTRMIQMFQIVSAMSEEKSDKDKNIKIDTDTKLESKEKSNEESRENEENKE